MKFNLLILLHFHNDYLLLVHFQLHLLHHHFR